MASVALRNQTQLWERDIIRLFNSLISQKIKLSFTFFNAFLAYWFLIALLSFLEVIFFILFLFCHTEETSRMIAYKVAISDDSKGTKKSPVHILSAVMTCLINAFLSCHLVFI